MSRKPFARDWKMSRMKGLALRAKFSGNSARGMAYLVRITSRAVFDLADLFDQIHADTSIPAFRWLDELEKAAGTLETIPRRCPNAPESESRGRRLRQLLYGEKPHVYRIIFEIDESEKPSMC